MQSNDSQALNDKKSIRGRFVIQEVIESDLYARDSTKKRRNTIKTSKFKLIAKSLTDGKKQTLFYVYDNISCMYISLEEVLKQYSLVYNSMSFPTYSKERSSKTRMRLPDINEIDEYDNISYIPKVDSNYSQPPHELYEKSSLLKKNERKRIDSNIILPSNSPFNQPKPKKIGDLWQMKSIEAMDNEDYDPLVYSIQHVISIMLKRRDFIEEKACAFCLE